MTDDTLGLTDGEDIQDSLVEYVENSELAEVAVVVLSALYLGAAELGYIALVPELRMLAYGVIAATVGLDTMYKRMRRKNGGK